jgi:hypothetical protein
MGRGKTAVVARPDVFPIDAIDDLNEPGGRGVDVGGQLTGLGLERGRLRPLSLALGLGAAIGIGRSLVGEHMFDTIRGFRPLATPFARFVVLFPGRR